MASQSGIKAGAAYVELFLKDKLSRGLQRASGRLKSWGASMQSMGTRMIAVSAAMALPLSLVTRSFADFDDQMRTVKAVTGATGKDFDMLTAKAKLLGRTTSYTASQVAAGMVEAGRAGFDPGQIDASIAAMLDLARATGTELPLATNIAAGTLRAFGMEAGRMGEVADIMTAAANNSAQTLEDMGEAMKYAAPVAAEYGMTLQETARMIGYLANFSIRGTMAGTTMKNIMLKLADPNIRKQVKGLGVDVTNAAGGMRPLADVMRDIGVAVQGLPAADRLALFKELFGMRAIAGGAKLTASSFKKLDDAIANFSGTAATTAKEMDSGIGGVLRRLWSAMEGVVLAIGDALAPALEAAAVPLGKLAGTLTKFIAKNPQFVTGLFKVVVGIAAVGAVALTLGTAIVGLGMV
ncbi:MAG: phage tail tape measure protein, partial [Planctomycetota bacterium]|nr:phage tail tape measure protein [Planctomycetota bacterium]